jgi:hypothetical protein
MISCQEFQLQSLHTQIGLLYEHGACVMSIRYYGYKVNLYLLENFYLEVFYNHKKDRIEKIMPLDTRHSRMNFYIDQIKLGTV